MIGKAMAWHWQRSGSSSKVPQGNAIISRQWQGNGAWDEENSGKFARLRELAEVIAAKQEKMLVFTQFRETTAPLAAFLGTIFGREGLVLHGGTPVAQRRELVKRFQEDDATPFFILSLKENLETWL